MRLYLINPSNQLVSILKFNKNRLNHYRVWKPLSLMVLAGLTPPEWDISIVDENLGAPDYRGMPHPDLVGITAFTSQASRAYEMASYFRNLGIPVVMEGIHATMCLEEVMEHVDSVVTGEAESIWARVLEDAKNGRMKRRYDGGLAEISELQIARHDHIARAKDLFRAMVKAGLRKQWVAQTSINFADDEELMYLAAKAGCSGVFIGFESPTPEGLLELGKKFNIQRGRNFHNSVRRIQRHGILVVGSFIIGLDVDKPGIGKFIAKTANRYGVDNLNALFLTPLPGTRLWEKMKSEGRISLDSFPEDWKYFTLTFPVARYKNLSLEDIIGEMISCNHDFYSMPRVLKRIWKNLRQRRKPLISLLSNLSYKNNLRLNFKAYSAFKSYVNDGI